MKLLRFVLLLVLPLLFLGATCVTRVEQKGPTGPWVGEATNNGPDPVSYVEATAQVFDANGQPLSYLSTQTCPPALLPNETGSFEMFFDAEYFPSAPLPLRAEFQPLAQAQPGLGWDAAREGLTAKLVEKDAARRYVIVEVTNESPRTYNNIVICANLRTPAGRLAEVGNNPLFPTILRPGEKGRVAILFNSMPDGSFDFFPSGNQGCCSDAVILDPSLFHVTAQKVVTGPQGRELQVVGEMENVSGQDLSGVTVQAYVEGEPAFPVWAEVGCGDGTIGRGAKGSAAFALPLQPGDKTSVVIAGIEGYQAGDLYFVPVSGVSETQQGEYYVASATLSNPTASWLRVEGACFNLRDSGGTLVGTGGTYVDQYLAPGATFPVSATVSPLATGVKSAEAVSYAEVVEGPPPTIHPPLY